MADKFVKLSASVPGGNGSGNTEYDYYAGMAGFNTAWALTGPGDTVWALEGTAIITSSIQMPYGTGGASGNLKRFKALPGHVVNVSGNHTYPPLDSNGLPPWTGLIMLDASYVEIDGINLINSGGNGLSINYIQAGGCTDITFKNSLIDDPYQMGIDGTLITNLTIDNVHINHAQCGSDLHPVWYPRWIASGLPPTHSSAIGVRKSTNVLIQNCICNDSFGEGIDVDNTIWSLPTSFYTNLNNNIVYNTASFQYYMQGLYGGTHLFYNNIGYSTSDLDSYIQSRIGTWRRDAFVFRPSELGFADADLANFIIYNNLAVQAQYGFLFTNWKDTVGTHNVQVLNNTVIGAEYGIHGGWYTQNGYSNTMYNNLVYAFPGQQVSVAAPGIWATGGWTCDYNSWYGDTPDPELMGAHDLYSNPGLVNVNAPVVTGALNPENYRPASGSSPIIDAGLDSGVAYDFFGLVRSGPDTIGFSEYGSPPTEHNLTALDIKSESFLEEPELTLINNDLTANSIKSLSRVDQPDLNQINHNLSANSVKSLSKLDSPSFNSQDNFGTLIQSKVGEVWNWVPQTYITMDFDSNPTPGSLLVAAHYCGDAIAYPPSGWSVGFKLTEPAPGYDDGGLYYKIAGQSEPTTVTATCSAANEHVMIIAEFAGPFANSPFETENHDAYATGDSPRVLNTSALTQLKNIIIGVAAGRDSGVEPVGGGGGFYTGFTEVAIHECLNKWVDLDYKVINSSSPQTASWDANNYYDTGHSAGIAIFKRLLIHGLIGLSINANSKLSVPELRQVHALGALSLNSRSLVTEPDPGQDYILIARPVRSESKLETPFIPPLETPLNLKVVSKLGKPVILQVHNLIATDINSEIELGVPEVGQIYSLTPRSVSSNSKLTSPDLIQIFALTSIGIRSKPKVQKTKITLLAKKELMAIFGIYRLDVGIEVLSSNSSIKKE